MSDIAVNLITLKEGAAPEDFAAFSRELDQPVLLAQDVVEGFEVFQAGERTGGAPGAHFVEVLTVRDWAEWEGVRDGLEELAPVVERFDQLVQSAETVFVSPVGGAS